MNILFVVGGAIAGGYALATAKKKETPAPVVPPEVTAKVVTSVFKEIEKGVASGTPPPLAASVASAEASKEINTIAAALSTPQELTVIIWWKSIAAIAGRQAIEKKYNLRGITAPANANRTAFYYEVSAPITILGQLQAEPSISSAAIQGKEPQKFESLTPSTPPPTQIAPLTNTDVTVTLGTTWWVVMKDKTETAQSYDSSHRSEGAANTRAEELKKQGFSDAFVKKSTVW